MKMTKALRKMIAGICAVALLLSMTVIVHASGVQLTAAQKTVVQGEGTQSVEIPIELSGNPGLLGVTVQVSYTEGMTLTNIATGSALSGLNLTKPGSLSVNPFSLVWDGLDAADSTNGVIATLTFDVPKGTVTTYSVTVTPNGVFDSNVADISDSVSVTNGSITITERPKENMTGLSLSNKTVTYNGEAQALAVAGTLPAGATVDYTYNGDAEVPSDAGTYAVEATVSATGYEDKVLNATLTINPKDLTVSGLAAQNKVYDKTTAATVTGGTLVGKVAGDDVFVTMPTSGTFANANAANNVAVTIPTLTLEGAKAGNYTLTQPTGLKANITKAPLTITIADKQMITNAAVPELTWTITSGALCDGDSVTGAPATTANGTRAGEFPITKGSLAVNANYDITFVSGTLTVSDKTPQNITVPTISEKTYGDAPFSVAATPDATSGLTEMTYTSSNPAIAEVTTDGTVTVKAAGTTTITVSQAGNDTYAPFTKAQTLTVKKVPITVTATAANKKVGTADPAVFAYTYSGTLVGEDAFTGALTRQSGEAVGTYNILQGSLTLGSNYEIDYVPAVFEILDKTPQSITVSAMPEKTYGDAAFSLTVTPDSVANLTEFTYESDNTDVAEIAADGTITVKAAGEANISVKQAGNDEYAAYTNTQKLVVNKKAVTVDSIDFDAKTAVLGGVFAADTEVALDFAKLNITINGDASETAYNVTATNLVLSGTGAENYAVSAESVSGTVTKTNIITVTATGENVTVSGAGVYYVGDTVTLVADVTRGYNFKGWFAGETVVSENATYTFTAAEDVNLVAKAEKISYGGGGSTKATVSFNTNGGSEIAAMQVERGTKVSALPVPTKAGYIFRGWYTDEALTQPASNNATIVLKTTLYAAWEKEADESVNNGVTGAADEIVLVIGKKEVSIWGEHKTNDVAPKLVNSRTMLPIRLIAEALGAEVIWTEDAPEQVIIKNGETTIKLEIGASVAEVNGEEAALDSPSFLENDRTYMPLRFISEALGAQVEWDEATQKVTIKK